MKKRNLLLIIVCILIVLISCSKKIDTTEHLYLCNALEENVTLNLFKGDTIFKYEIKPNDTIYLTTIHSGYVVGGGVNCHFPPATDRGEYLCSFDSATVAYNSLIYLKDEYVGLRDRLLFEKHFFTGAAGAQVIRLLPSLTVSRETAESFVNAWRQLTQ